MGVLQFGLIPVNRFHSIKKSGDTFLAVNQNKISLSKDFKDWGMSEPCDDVKKWSNPKVLNGVIICVSQDSDKYLTFNPSAEAMFKIKILASKENKWSDIAVGNNNIMIGGESSIIHIKTNDLSEPIDYKRCNLKYSSKYPIDKMFFFDDRFIVFHKDISVVTFSDKDINNWEGACFTESIERWLWDDIVAFKDGLLCLNSETNQILAINKDFVNTGILSLPLHMNGAKWDKFSLFNGILAIISSEDDSHCLITTTLFDWYTVAPMKECKKVIVADSNGSVVLGVESEQCEVIPLDLSSIHTNH